MCHKEMPQPKTASANLAYISAAPRIATTVIAIQFTLLPIRTILLTLSVYGNYTAVISSRRDKTLYPVET
jgi:hypothetical protein